VCARAQGHVDVCVFMFVCVRACVCALGVKCAGGDYCSLVSLFACLVPVVVEVPLYLVIGISFTTFHLHWNANLKVW